MINNDENTIFIIDDNGDEKSFEIILTFDIEDKQYVIVQDPLNSEDVFAFSYDEEGNLYSVDDTDELAIVSEVLNAFEEEDD